MSKGEAIRDHVGPGSAELLRNNGAIKPLVPHTPLIISSVIRSTIQDEYMACSVIILSIISYCWPRPCLICCTSSSSLYNLCGMSLEREQQPKASTVPAKVLNQPEHPPDPHKHLEEPQDQPEHLHL
nr:hypothetical protein [Tanacetum cinerariifolium]